MARDLSREIRKRVFDSLNEAGIHPEGMHDVHIRHGRHRAPEQDEAAGLNNERMRVLELLEQGKITAAEAAELLRALGDDDRELMAGGAAPRGERPRWFRVRVTEVATGRQKANVSIPFGMVNFGL